MPIYRNIEKKEFTRIDNSLINDEGLSYKARGILAYLLSKPDNWTVSIGDISNKSEKDGKESIKSAFKELVDKGYAVLSNQFKTLPCGKRMIIGKRYSIHEKPQAENTTVVKNHCGETPPRQNTTEVKNLEGKTPPISNEPSIVTTDKDKQINSSKAKRFLPPTKKETLEFFIERKSSKTEASKFWYFYDSKNWMVGKNKMKKWRSSATNWINKNSKTETLKIES